MIIGPLPLGGMRAPEDVVKVYQCQVTGRLKSVEGHVRGILRMVEQDRPCVEIIHQVQAVQRALERVNSLLLEGHLQACVTEAVRGEDAGQRERVLGELMDMFDTARALRAGGDHGDA